MSINLSYSPLTGTVNQMSIYYSIRHTTRFRYDNPIRESVMETRLQPLTEGTQRCLEFSLTVNPRARTHDYRDYMGNTVHHFDIPGQHTQITVTATSLIEVQPMPVLPDALSPDDWLRVDTLANDSQIWDMLQPSTFTQSEGLLDDLAAELRLERRGDPLSLVREINGAIFSLFDYVPQSTSVDSPIDDALQDRRGVCQDFTHILIALVRRVGIPCRYVSGYLFHQQDIDDRSAADATHAWAEALLPDLGWVGLDPTNNLIAGTRHVRVAVGRDYSDVPPTRGIFKGKAESKLHVAVSVAPADAPEAKEALPVPTGWIPDEVAAKQLRQIQLQQSQEQQQQ